MIEQENPSEELNEKKAHNLSDMKFRVMIIRIYNSMKKDIRTVKKDQSEIKNAISKINNTLGRMKSRLEEAQV